MITKVVLPQEVVFSLLKHLSFHRNVYERVYSGSFFFWEAFYQYGTQWKNITSKHSVLIQKQLSKIQDKIIQLKEEKTLLTHFLIAARKRPELGSTHYIGNYKFSVVPKTFFSPDFESLLHHDKKSLTHEMSYAVQT